VTCSPEEWDEQISMLKGATYDLDRYYYNPNLYLPESEAQAIRQVLSRNHNAEYMGKFLQRYWRIAIPDSEFYSPLYQKATRKILNDD